MFVVCACNVAGMTIRSPLRMKSSSGSKVSLSPTFQNDAMASWSTPSGQGSPHHPFLMRLAISCNVASSSAALLFSSRAQRVLLQNSHSHLLCIRPRCQRQAPWADGATSILRGYWHQVYIPLKPDMGQDGEIIIRVWLVVWILGYWKLRAVACGLLPRQQDCHIHMCGIARMPRWRRDSQLVCGYCCSTGVNALLVYAMT